jgi:hypothetical protein
MGITGGRSEQSHNNASESVTRSNVQTHFTHDWFNTVAPHKAQTATEVFDLRRSWPVEDSSSIPRQRK